MLKNYNLNFQVYNTDNEDWLTSILVFYLIFFVFQTEKLSWISSTLTEFRPRNFVPIASICSLSGINAVQKFAFVVKSFTKPPIRLSFTSNNKLVTSRITRCFTTQTNSAFDSILVLFDCSLSGYCRVFNFFITYKFLLTQQIFKNNTNVIILHFIKIFWFLWHCNIQSAFCSGYCNI